MRRPEFLMGDPHSISGDGGETGPGRQRVDGPGDLRVGDLGLGELVDLGAQFGDLLGLVGIVAGLIADQTGHVVGLGAEVRAVGGQRRPGDHESAQHQDAGRHQIGAQSVAQPGALRGCSRLPVGIRLRS